MKRLMFLTAAALTLVPALGTAQEENGLVLEREWHVRPGHEAAFEAARQRVVEYFAETDYPFNQIVNHSTADNVYRIFSFLDDGWSDLEAIDRWTEDLDGPPPEAMRDMAAAATVMNRRIWRSRRDVSYSPSEPRLQPGETGFVNEVRFTLPPGAAAGRAAAVVGEMSALYARHNNARRRAVWTSFAGNSGAVLTTFHFARDTADHAEQGARESEVMGDELSNLRGNLSELALTREFITWETRPDLRYQRVD